MEAITTTKIHHELARIIADRIRLHCVENGFKPAEFGYDLDDFYILSVGDVMSALAIAEGTSVFDGEAFEKDIRNQLLTGPCDCGGNRQDGFCVNGCDNDEE